MIRPRRYPERWRFLGRSAALAAGLALAWWPVAPATARTSLVTPAVAGPSAPDADPRRSPVSETWSMVLQPPVGDAPPPGPPNAGGGSDGMAGLGGAADPAGAGAGSTAGVPPIAAASGGAGRVPGDAAPATAAPAAQTPPPALGGAGGGPAHAARTNLTEVSAVKTTRPVAALTFDCGSALGALPRMLDTLAEYGVRVTFFVTGDFAERYPDAIVRMAAEGHEVANHTVTHRDLALLGDDTIRWELRRTDEIVSALTGVTTQPLMRMPFGSRNGRVVRIVNEEGYRSIFWSLDSGDWRDTATTPGVLQRVLRYTEAGDIVVHHCLPAQTANALPAILAGLAAQGLSVVTVSDLLRDE